MAATNDSSFDFKTQATCQMIVQSGGYVQGLYFLLFNISIYNILVIWIAWRILKKYVLSCTWHKVKMFNIWGLNIVKQRHSLHFDIMCE